MTTPDFAAQAREVIARWRQEQPSEHDDKHAQCMAMHIEHALHAAYERGLGDAAAICAVHPVLRDSIRALARKERG